MFRVISFWFLLLDLKKNIPEYSWICFILYQLKLKSNQIFIMVVLVTVKCSELAEQSIAATYAVAHSAKLHRWRVDGNFCSFDRLGV